MKALILAVMLAAAAVPPFPFTNYDDIPGIQPTGVMCGGNVQRLEGPEWYIMTTDGRDIIAHKTAEGGIDFVYFIVGEANPIAVRFALTFEQAKERYPNPCAYFVEQDT